MGIYRSEIADLRRNLEENIGKKIIVKESPGKRSKPQEKVAVIENTYPQYFRVKFEEVDRVGSYNYTDLFTKTVEMRFCDGEPFAPVLQNHVELKKHTKQQETIVENS
jgi:uncharacterized protein Veg